jgi:hypothetical protein
LLVVVGAMTMGCSAAPVENPEEKVDTTEQELGPWPTHCAYADTLAPPTGFVSCKPDSPASCWTDNFVRFEGHMNGDGCRAGGYVADDGTVLRTVVHYVTSAHSRDTNLYFYALCPPSFADAEGHVAQYANVPPVWSKAVYCYKDGYASPNKQLVGHGGINAMVVYYDPTCAGCAPKGPYVPAYTFEQ